MTDVQKVYVMNQNRLVFSITGVEILGMIGVGYALVRGMDGIANDIIYIVNTVAPLIIKILPSLFNTILEGIVSALPEAVVSITKGITTLIPALTGALRQIIPSLIEAIPDVISTIMDASKSIMVDLLASLSDSILAPFIKPLEALYSWLGIKDPEKDLNEEEKRIDDNEPYVRTIKNNRTIGGKFSDKTDDELVPIEKETIQRDFKETNGKYVTFDTKILTPAGWTFYHNIPKEQQFGPYANKVADKIDAKPFKGPFDDLHVWATQEWDKFIRTTDVGKGLNDFGKGIENVVNGIGNIINDIGGWFGGLFK